MEISECYVCVKAEYWRNKSTLERRNICRHCVEASKKPNQESSKILG